MNNQVSAHSVYTTNPSHFFKGFVPDHLASFFVATNIGRSVQDSRSDLLKWTLDASGQGISWVRRNGVLFFNEATINCYVGAENRKKQANNNQKIDVGV